MSFITKWKNSFFKQNLMRNIAIAPEAVLKQDKDDVLLKVLSSQIQTTPKVTSWLLSTLFLTGLLFRQINNGGVALMEEWVRK